MKEGRGWGPKTRKRDIALVTIKLRPKVVRETGESPILVVGGALEFFCHLLFTTRLFVVAPVFRLANPKYRIGVGLVIRP